MKQEGNQASRLFHFALKLTFNFEKFSVSTSKTIMRLRVWLSFGIMFLKLIKGKTYKIKDTGNLPYLITHKGRLTLFSSSL